MYRIFHQLGRAAAISFTIVQVSHVDQAQATLPPSAVAVQAYEAKLRQYAGPEKLFQYYASVRLETPHGTGTYLTPADLAAVVCVAPPPDPRSMSLLSKPRAATFPTTASGSQVTTAMQHLAAALTANTAEAWQAVLDARRTGAMPRSVYVAAAQQLALTVRAEFAEAKKVLDGPYAPLVAMQRAADMAMGSDDPKYDLLLADEPWAGVAASASAQRSLMDAARSFQRMLDADGGMCV